MYRLWFYDCLRSVVLKVGAIAPLAGNFEDQGGQKTNGNDRGANQRNG